jgi:hypothetical protein
VNVVVNYYLRLPIQMQIRASLETKLGKFCETKPKSQMALATYFFDKFPVGNEDEELCGLHPSSFNIPLLAVEEFPRFHLQLRLSAISSTEIETQVPSSFLWN